MASRDAGQRAGRCAGPPGSSPSAAVRLGRVDSLRAAAAGSGAGPGALRSLSLGILCALYLWILALVAVADLERRRIYDAVMLPVIALSALAAPVSPRLEGGAIGAWGMGVGAFIFFFGGRGHPGWDRGRRCDAGGLHRADRRLPARPAGAVMGRSAGLEPSPWGCCSRGAGRGTRPSPTAPSWPWAERWRCLGGGRAWFSLALGIDPRFRFGFVRRVAGRMARGRRFRGLARL
jgi:hypothetical protein